MYNKMITINWLRKFFKNHKLQEEDAGRFNKKLREWEDFCYNAWQVTCKPRRSNTYERLGEKAKLLRKPSSSAPK